MAAIDTLHDFTGTGLSGFTNTGVTFSEVGGACVPDDFSLDGTMIWNTAFPQSTAPTQGLVGKWTLSGGCEAGTTLHLIFDYVDANNYRYARLVIDGLTVFTDVKHDEITLWDVTGGVHTPISGFTPTRNWQQSPGDMRAYRVVSGSAISVHKWSNQLVVKFTANDSTHGYNWNTDIIHLTEKVTQKTTNGKLGWTSKGGAHTTAIDKLQGEVFTVYYMSQAGDDGDPGDEAAPFLTFNKLVQTVGLKQVGVIVGGTYTETFGTGQNAPMNCVMQNGTSYEDAPTYMQKIGDTVIQKANSSSGCMSFKATPTVTLAYNVFFGWELDGNISRGAGTALDCAKTWGQFVGGTNKQNHHLRWQSMDGHHNIGGANFSAQAGVFYDVGIPPYTVAPIESDYYTYNHWLDIYSHESTDWPIPTPPYPGGTAPHGFYLSESYMVVEYCDAVDNYGDGGKFFHGTQDGQFGLGVLPVNYNRLRFCYLARNRLYGWILSRGTDNQAYTNLFEDGGVNWDSVTTQMHGCVFLGQSANGRIINCIATGNRWMGFGIEQLSGSSTGLDNNHVVNCTAYNNKYNYGTRCIGTGMDGILWMNCTSHNPTTAHWLNEGGNQVNEVFTTNHQTSGSGFGTVTGDPLFEDQQPSGTGDYHIKAGSPLIGAGTDASSYTTVDYDQRTRTTNDIGAFWYPGLLTTVSGSDTNRIGTTTLGVISNLNPFNPEETILKLNLGAHEEFKIGVPQRIFWYHDPNADETPTAIPFVTIKVSADNEATFEQTFMNVPNVSGWNSRWITFKTLSSQYRILLYDPNRLEVLSRGPGLMTVVKDTESVGAI